MGFLLPLATETTSAWGVPEGVWMALTAALAAIALWFRRSAGRVVKDERYRGLSLALLEKILKAANRPCCTLDCPWAEGKIPEAWKREVENVMLKMRLDFGDDKRR